MICSNKQHIVAYNDGKANIPHKNDTAGKNKTAAAENTPHVTTVAGLKRSRTGSHSRNENSVGVPAIVKP
jgi:hypothetical protein